MRLAAAALVAVLLLMPSLVATPSDADSFQEVVGTSYLPWHRTAEPLDSTYLDHAQGIGRLFVSEDPEDPSFRSYMKGEIPISDLSWPEIEEGRSYYVFFSGNRSLVTESHGVVELMSLPHVLLEQDPPTMMRLKEGTYTLSAEHELTMMPRHVVVTNGVGWSESYTMRDKTLTFRVFYEDTYFISMDTEEYCTMKFHVVSGDVEVLPSSSGTDSCEVSTGYRWARGIVRVDPGQHFFSCNVFPEGSDEDKRFMEEVVKPMSSIVPEWAKNAGTVIETGQGAMAAYELIYGDSMVVRCSDVKTTADGKASYSTSSRNIVPDDLRLFGPDLKDRVTLFAMANEPLSLTMSYDFIKYRASLTANGSTMFLAPDCRYDLTFSESSQLDIKIAPSTVAEGPEHFSTTVLLSAQGTKAPDGAATFAAVALIGAFAVTISALFLAGRGPRWPD
ncbi:MAG: hypothetical protein IKQ60_06155 [Candidatus Methanomethylophilaceae archaeon]|nr:hypothetical protein [Candidatus Methanomethylophilaceae archaeon]